MPYVRATDPGRKPGDPGNHLASLLAYCKMDTWAMVKLVERLRELAG